MKISTIGAVAIVAVTLLGASCLRSAEAAKRTNSGIRGVAMVGPVYPSQKPGQPNSKPLGGAIITVQPQNGGSEIARTVADSQGRFILTVSAGTYKIVPLPPKPGSYFPSARPFILTIPDSVYVYRQIDYDSGIR